MGETDTQEVTNYRDQLVGRAQTRYPDRTFTGQDGQIDQNGLEQSISEILGELDAKIKEYDDNNGRLVNLFNTNPKAAGFLNEWVRSQNPAAAFRKYYGPEAFAAMQTEEGAEIIAQIEADEAKRKAESEAFEQEKADNLQKSFDALDEWGNSKGLTDEQKTEVFMRFYNILSDALEGKYSTDLFEMAWKADHYSDDIASARHEGEVAGRNANIKAQARKRQEAAALPPQLAGQGEAVPEAAPKKERKWGDFLK